MEENLIFVFKGDFEKDDYIFEKSEIFTFKLSLNNEESIEFYVYQNLNRQDFSLRMWLSYEQRSIAVDWQNKSLKSVHLRKFPIKIKVTRNKEDLNQRFDKTNPFFYIFFIEQDTVFVNFQNLENSVNGFSII